MLKNLLHRRWQWRFLCRCFDCYFVGALKMKLYINLIKYKRTLIESRNKSETAIIMLWPVWWSVWLDWVNAEVSFRRKLGSLIKCWNLTGDLVGVESESPNGLKIPAGIGRFVVCDTLEAESSIIVVSIEWFDPRTLNRDEFKLDRVTSNLVVVVEVE